MKKVLSLFFFVLLSLIFFMPMFVVQKKYTYAEAIEENGIEDEYYISGESQDLIAKEIDNASIVGCSVSEIENTAPFDKNLKKKMSGKIITPSADEYGQVRNKSLKINYVAGEEDVLFLWVYIFDMSAIIEYTYNLKITLTDNSINSFTKEFSGQEIKDFGSGWKLLAIKISDFSSEDDNEIIGKSFTNLVINFYSEITDMLEDPELTQDEKNAAQELMVKTNERFSLYHVFVTKNANFNKNSGKIVDLGGSFYEFSEKFSIANDVFLKDKIKISSMNEVFKYLYVGKYDLSDYISTGKYKWELTLKSPSNGINKLNFGDEITFNETGYYYLSIYLYEITSLKQVLKETITIFCDEANLGHFIYGSSYKLKDNDRIELSFKVASCVSLEEDFEFTMNNNNVEIESYYEKDGILYVCIAGKASGKTTLQISAKGHTNFNSTSQTFLASVSLNVESSEESVDIFMIILWVTFACFCIAIIIYFLISLVKARKNDVK